MLVLCVALLLKTTHSKKSNHYEGVYQCEGNNILYNVDTLSLLASG